MTALVLARPPRADVGPSRGAMVLLGYGLAALTSVAAWIGIAQGAAWALSLIG